MFDPITATPDAIAKQLWHLTEQHACLMEQGSELSDAAFNYGCVQSKIQLELVSMNISTLEAILDEVELFTGFLPSTSTH